MHNVGGKCCKDRKIFETSDELFINGCYTKTCINRLIEDLELENHIDFFLSSECLIG